MKKTALVTIPALCLALSQTALADIPSIVSADVSEIVTLGKYKGLELEKTVKPVSDEEVDARIEGLLADAKEDAGDGPVESGDVATIAYVGKKDGVAFDGGTSDGYPLEIGSGTFIPGFEDGVIGMKKGETKDIELTFPEQYQNADLAGQDVVFTVTVQSISRTPELSEDWVKNNTEAGSVEEYKQQIREELEEEADKEADSAVRQAAFQMIMEDSEFGDIPEEDIKYGEDYERQSAESMAAYFGMELEDLLTAQGYTMEQFEEECREYGENQAKVFYIFQAILDAEGIVISDEEAEKILETYFEAYNVSTVQDLYDVAGEDSVNRAVVTEKAMQVIMENAKISGTSEKPEEAAPAEKEAEASEEEKEAETPAGEADAAAEKAPAEEAPAEEAPAEETSAEEDASIADAE